MFIYKNKEKQFGSIEIIKKLCESRPTYSSFSVNYQENQILIIEAYFATVISINS